MRVIVCACAAAVVAAASLSAQVMPDERSRRQSFQHYQAGQEFLATEQWEKAASAFQQAIRLHRLFTDAHYGLGVAYMGLQRYVSAARAYEDCLAATRSLHALGERQRVEFDRLLDEEAREVADTVRRLRGGLKARRLDQRVTDLKRMRPSLGASYEPPAGVLLALGSAHFRNGDAGRAEYYWREAARIDSALGEAWNNLAAVFAASARKGEAANAIAQAERNGFRVNPRLKEDVRLLP